VRYFNNIVKQDHRSVKRATRPMLAFKAFEAAQRTSAGIDLNICFGSGNWQVESNRVSQWLNRSLRWRHSHPQGKASFISSEKLRRSFNRFEEMFEKIFEEEE
jgi:hypothetical protein